MPPGLQIDIKLKCVASLISTDCVDAFGRRRTLSAISSTALSAIRFGLAVVVVGYQATISSARLCCASGRVADHYLKPVVWVFPHSPLVFANAAP